MIQFEDIIVMANELVGNGQSENLKMDGDGTMATKESMGNNALDAERQAIINRAVVDGNETIEFPEFIVSIASPAGGFTLLQEKNELIAQYQLIR
ncbi:hypothetical protein GJ496_005396 [Pomphorhynchus laevis]|nr:hypothetical protein GJ496_005396 [Pomphorhynchus laevis]